MGGSIIIGYLYYIISYKELNDGWLCTPRHSSQWVGVNKSRGVSRVVYLLVLHAQSTAKAIEMIRATHFM